MSRARERLMSRAGRTTAALGSGAPGLRSLSTGCRASEARAAARVQRNGAAVVEAHLGSQQEAAAGQHAGRAQALAEERAAVVRQAAEAGGPVALARWRPVANQELDTLDRLRVRSAHGGDEPAAPARGVQAQR